MAGVAVGSGVALLALAVGTALLVVGALETSGGAVVGAVPSSALPVQPLSASSPAAQASSAPAPLAVVVRIIASPLVRGGRVAAPSILSSALAGCPPPPAGAGATTASAPRRSPRPAAARCR
ncbi:hypothetical protein C5C95_00960 [Rathayibacter sp. AY1B7]|nr:hypothetical protein C5C95_00960 [Rathayibacter sp. AY1B7]